MEDWIPTYIGGESLHRMIMYFKVIWIYTYQEQNFMVKDLKYEITQKWSYELVWKIVSVKEGWTLESDEHFLQEIVYAF